MILVAITSVCVETLPQFDRTDEALDMRFVLLWGRGLYCDSSILRQALMHTLTYTLSKTLTLTNRNMAIHAAEG